MAFCTPGHLSGAILGIYAVLRAQIALLKVHWVYSLGKRATLDLSALATGSCVVAKPVLPWCGEGSTLLRPRWAEAGGGGGLAGHLVVSGDEQQASG